MEANDLERRLEELNEQYSKTKYNKATNKYLGILRAKIAKVKKQMSSKRRNRGTGFAVKKTGDATVALVGFPNAGKSSVLIALTGVESKVAEYAFTTLTVIPGMLEINKAKIQFLDTPGLIEGAHIGRGGGRQIVSAIRVVDLILFIVDVNAYSDIPALIRELNDLGIDVSGKAGAIRIENRESGGITILKGPKAVKPTAEILDVLGQLGVHNANIYAKGDFTVDELIEAAANEKASIKSIIALNKIDTNRNFERAKSVLESATGIPVVAISAKTGTGLQELKNEISRNLGLIRVYLKRKGEAPDMSNPLVVKEGSSLEDIARKVHDKMASESKSAYVMGRSVRFGIQKVGLDHIAKDGDVVTFISR